MEVQTLKTNSFISKPIQTINKQQKDIKKGFSIDDIGKNQELNTKEKIDQMLKDITELKDKMEFELTVENVMKYKKIIKSFLQFYVENALTTHDIMSRSSNGLPEKMTIVKKVEEGIEDLDDTLSLLDTKSGHLDMLRRIDEINGLIIDLKY